MTTEKSFRDKLLAREPAIGSDGATWELGHIGSVKANRYWGFLRTPPGGGTVIWQDVGVRRCGTPVEAVDELETKLKLLGEGWREGDARWKARSDRAAAAMARCRDRVPDGFHVFEDRGRFEVRGPDGGFVCSVYLCDLANGSDEQNERAYKRIEALGLPPKPKWKGKRLNRAPRPTPATAAAPPASVEIAMQAV